MLPGVQSAAAEALTYACNHCHKDAARQKMRILQFLIPVQMLLGKLPSAAIRHKYNMHIYDTIIEVTSSAIAVTKLDLVPKAHDVLFSTLSECVTVLACTLLRCSLRVTLPCPKRFVECSQQAPTGTAHGMLKVQIT